MELTQQNRDTILIGILLILLFLVLAFAAMVLNMPASETVPVADYSNTAVPLFYIPSKTDLCYQAAYSTFNESYIEDPEFAAVSVWHKLMKQGIACTLLVGNLSISDESITESDSIWVVVGDLAIDGGEVYTDPQHQEGYSVSSPQHYGELMDAIDDYKEAKARYISAVDTYNTLLTQAAKDNSEAAKAEYIAANNRLISEIS